MKFKEFSKNKGGKSKIKKTNKQKGITLVALVITIIILLILAGISITSLTKNGLLVKAQEAKQKTENAQAEENIALAEYKQWMENYKGENSPSETQTLASKVKPGEYVKYIPDKVNTTDEAYTNLISDLGTYSGNGENTALTQEEMNWRVLDVVNGKVRLISENPTSNNVTLSGYNGYNNAVYLLDKTCRTLYNKTGYTENIQNLKIEDIQNKMKTTDYNAIYPSYGTPLSPTNNLYYPSIFAQEEGQKIDGTTGTLGLSKQTDPIEQTIIEIYPEESWEVKFTYWTKTMEKYDFTNPIYYDLFINNDTNSYWMSSRCVSADSDYAAFNVRSVYSGSVNALNLYVSSSASASYSIGFRPVITLNSNVSVTSGDGTKSLPYVIGL